MLNADKAPSPQCSFHAAYHAALEVLDKAVAPLEWVVTQVSLGDTLQILGQRTGDMARLKEALTCYGAALDEITQAGAPYYWTKIQTSRANALWKLGDRLSDTAHLEEAVVAYRATLEELRPERTPWEWASATTNLGSVLAVVHPLPLFAQCLRNESRKMFRATGLRSRSISAVHS